MKESIGRQNPYRRRVSVQKTQNGVTLSEIRWFQQWNELFDHVSWWCTTLSRQGFQSANHDGDDPPGRRIRFPQYWSFLLSGGTSHQTSWIYQSEAPSRLTFPVRIFFVFGPQDAKVRRRVGHVFRINNFWSNLKWSMKWSYIASLRWTRSPLLGCKSS